MLGRGVQAGDGLDGRAGVVTGVTQVRGEAWTGAVERRCLLGVTSGEAAAEKGEAAGATLRRDDLLTASGLRQSEYISK